MRLPSGRSIRGRSLAAHPAGEPPQFGLYLGRPRGTGIDWEHRWLQWPDFGLPRSQPEAASAFLETWQRAAFERVEVACGGGRGRTGVALACIAILDGVNPRNAVAFVRERYDARAVETPWQKRFVAEFRMNVRAVVRPSSASAGSSFPGSLPRLGMSPTEGSAVSSHNELSPEEHIPAPEESTVPEIEADQTVAPRPEEEIADVLRAEPDVEDHSKHSD